MFKENEPFEPFKISPNAKLASVAQREEYLKNPGFGKVFTDHMALAYWHKDKGWHDAQIKEYGSLELHPANPVLHYAQEIFEGLKAYRSKKGEILLFRPYENAKRFNRSAQRLAMPNLPEEIFVHAIRELVKIDQDWVSAEPDSSLYLRPFMIAEDNHLGIHAAESYIFAVIASPVQNYFKQDAGGLTLWLESEYCRAGPGGTGTVKCGGNYAASLVAIQKAYTKDCDQTLFLDAKERKWIEELGGMNVFFVTDDKCLRTPPLTCNILPGITRASLIKIATDMGYTVKEEMYSFEQLKEDVKNNKIIEAFACGTAAIVAPISVIKYEGGVLNIGDGSWGEHTAKLRAYLLGLQTANIPDPYGWVERIA